MKETEAVILSAVRTPMGRFQGALSGLPATRLGAVAVRAAVERAGVDPMPVSMLLAWKHMGIRSVPPSILTGTRKSRVARAKKEKPRREGGGAIWGEIEVSYARSDSGPDALILS